MPPRLEDLANSHPIATGTVGSVVSFLATVAGGAMETFHQFAGLVTQLFGAFAAIMTCCLMWDRFSAWLRRKFRRRPPGSFQIVLAAGAALFLGACSSTPPRSFTPYLAPSAAPVRKAVKVASTEIAAARTASTRAAAAISKAQVSAARILELAPVAKAEVDELSAQLLEAKRATDEANERATVAGSELAAAEARIDALEADVGKQTAALNKQASARIDAENERDAAKKKLSAVRRQRNWLLAIAIGAGLFFFRRPIGALFGIPIP